MTLWFLLAALLASPARTLGEEAKEGLHFEHCETRRKNKQAAASTLECQRCVVLNLPFLCTTFGLSAAAPLSHWVTCKTAALMARTQRSPLSASGSAMVAL